MRCGLITDWRPVLCASIDANLLTTCSKLDVCLEMFNCLQAEQTIAIRKRKFLNKFSVINNVLCQVFVVNAKKELASC